MCPHLPGSRATERETGPQQGRSLPSGQIRACRRGKVLARCVLLYELLQLALVEREVRTLACAPNSGYDVIF